MWVDFEIFASGAVVAVAVAVHMEVRHMVELRHLKAVAVDFEIFASVAVVDVVAVHMEVRHMVELRHLKAVAVKAVGTKAVEGASHSGCTVASSD